jgi:release factor glutamine methyltransferase
MSNLDQGSLIQTPASLITRLRQAGCVFAEEEARLLISTAKTATELESMAQQRVEGLPLEHILGWVEFYGQRIVVEPQVFVPRRRSEFLARKAIALTKPGDVVVDLCCGSGALGAVISTAVHPVELHLADIEPAATRCARRNIGHLGQVHEGDLYNALPTRLEEQINVLVVNAPYVPTHAIETMPPEAREHEPRVALDGGLDGLDMHRRVAAEVCHWLAPGGHLFVETSDLQAARTAEIFTQAGLRIHLTHCPEVDANVVIGEN